MGFQTPYQDLLQAWTAQHRGNERFGALDDERTDGGTYASMVVDTSGSNFSATWFGGSETAKGAVRGINQDAVFRLWFIRAAANRTSGIDDGLGLKIEDRTDSPDVPRKILDRVG